MKGRALIVATLVGVGGLGSQVSAQSEQGTTPLRAGFVGAGIGLASDDASSRMRLYEEGRPKIWVVEAGVAVGPRVGIGVEFSQPSPAVASTVVGLGRTQSAGRQRERLLLGVLRFRLAGADRLALDLVGGAGAVFQHHETGICTPPAEPCPTDGSSMNHRAPAFMAGADVPIRVARHLALGAQFRVHALRRGEHTSESMPGLPWQFEWKSSTRVSVGTTGRIVW